MNSNETVKWLNQRDPLHEWSTDDDVFCLHCDGVFKVQDVARDHEDDPICPVCEASTPLDFHKIPWWREDLVDQTADREGPLNLWRVEPITAQPGKPSRLSAQ